MLKSWNWNKVCALEFLAQFSHGPKISEELKPKINFALKLGKEVALVFYRAVFWEKF